MGRLLEDLIGKSVGRAVGEDAVIGGLLFALAFWFLDYAVIETLRRRFVYAALCGVVGAVLLLLLLAAEWEANELLRSGVMGVIVYAPLFAFARRDMWGSNRADRSTPAPPKGRGGTGA